MIDQVVEKVVYVDQPLEKVSGRLFPHRRASFLFFLVGACAHGHADRVGKPVCLASSLADPRGVSFPDAPGQVAGGVGGIAMGDEVRVFPWRGRGRNALMQSVSEPFACRACPVAG